MARQKLNKKKNQNKRHTELIRTTESGRMTDPKTLIMHPKQCSSSVSDLIVLQCGLFNRGLRRFRSLSGNDSPCGRAPARFSFPYNLRQINSCSPR